jgi:hypothetical protein
LSVGFIWTKFKFWIWKWCHPSFNWNKKTNTISFDELTKVNELLSSKFDAMAELNDKYILEVSSAGIERQIKTEDDLKKQSIFLCLCWVFEKWSTTWVYRRVY